jgi:hypothetical protein
MSPLKKSSLVFTKIKNLTNENKPTLLIKFMKIMVKDLECFAYELLWVVEEISNATKEGKISRDKTCNNARPKFNSHISNKWKFKIK